jgi:hypothetical protein
MRLIPACKHFINACTSISWCIDSPFCCSLVLLLQVMQEMLFGDEAKPENHV